MIPVLAGAGHRVLVPDLIGFGRSDKPAERSAYTYAGHVKWMRGFLEATAAERGDGPLHLFGQDWGGLIGLRLAAENPDLIDRLILANTALPVGDSPGAGFDFWRQFSQDVPFLDCGRLVENATANELSDAAIDAYPAPFPDELYRAGARQFPPVPAAGSGLARRPGRARQQGRPDGAGAVTKPVLTLWAPGDPVLGGLRPFMVERIPGPANQPHAQFEPASHLIQEDQGPALAEAVNAWLAAA
ncbi:MAG: alpha/beta fold hydrolase [Acidimicrobiaceae bacterium]|nr:alpha/beta fold hydrolase [Acidimicrobiaceae bacterium]